MKNKKRTAKQNIKGCLRSTSGLSLVELVVAVAILAALSSILLHAFLTSNTVTNKARKMSEATDCAQNIQETIEALSVENFFAAGLDPDDEGYKPDAVERLGLENGAIIYSPRTEEQKLADPTTDGNEIVTVKGLKSGKSSFDAVVTFANGVRRDNKGEPEWNDNLYTSKEIQIPQKYYNINTKKLIKYDEPDAVWMQANEDPDLNSQLEFEDKNENVKNVLKKERTIKLNIEASEKENGKVTAVSVTGVYDYNIEYTFDVDRNSLESHTSDVSGRNTFQYKEPILSEDLLSNETYDGSFKTILFLYNPCYNDYAVRDAASLNPENTVYLDNVEISNLDDLNVRIILIKQLPLMAPPDDAWECNECHHVGLKFEGTCPACGSNSVKAFTYELCTKGSVTDNDDGTVDYNHWVLINPDGTVKQNFETQSTPYSKSEILSLFKLNGIGTTLDGLEKNYQITVKEYHSSNYVDSLKKAVADKTFLTNAGMNLSTTERNGDQESTDHIRYFINGINQLGMNAFRRQYAESLEKGELIEKKESDRLYDIMIELYDPGELDKSNPKSFTVFTASKLN